VAVARPSRRERVRAATFEEINQIARRLLVEEGKDGVTLRAIAREMGVTAAALYRYFPSLEHLLTALASALFDELRIEMERARDDCPASEVAAALLIMARGFRQWSITHPAEFALMFATPVAGLAAGQQVDATSTSASATYAADEFARVFAAQFAEVWRQTRFAVPTDDQIATPLHSQLVACLATLGVDMPAGAMLTFLSLWFRLYGMVALEVFGKFQFALSDPEPMFEAEFAAVARELGLASAAASAPASSP
jgi:AcrR family transcriptional regulator